MIDSKIVQSEVQPLSTIFKGKYIVDFFQREYVWQKKQLEDLLIDLSTEFLKSWRPGDTYDRVANYDPYFMGEIVTSLKTGGVSSIIDGQQRITTFTLLLIYLVRTYGKNPDFPLSDVEPLIQSNHYGKKKFNLDIDERTECMGSLLLNGEYVVRDSDTASVRNIVDIYESISEFWNPNIAENNIIHFVYWLKDNVLFSKVWTNSDEFGYVIFETMNDRGLSLTQVEMLRSFLLANISEDKRNKAVAIFGDVVYRLTAIKLASKSKAEFEFFKAYFRGHYAEDSASTTNGQGDFERIGKEFHRWFRDNTTKLGLKNEKAYWDFLNRLSFYSKVYEKIHKFIQDRNTVDYLYLIVNADYGFTLQPQLIMAAINEDDDQETVNEKIKIVSKYLTKVLTWRVWNHWVISQSSLDSPIYELCKLERGKDLEELKELFDSDPIPGPILENYPTLNQQNRWRLKVLLSLITEIVAANSGTPDYMLNKTFKVDIEHIWANHYEQHTDECESQEDFSNVRNSIGDLLVLPKSFNSSYGDNIYEDKMPQYFEQNILAQSLCKAKYEHNPGFLHFKEISQLNFKPYEHFKRADIIERGELYKSILRWNWNITEEHSTQSLKQSRVVYKIAKEWVNDKDEIELGTCERTYIRFTTRFMSVLFPKTDIDTGWDKGNHYYYELYIKKGRAARFTLVFSSKGLPEEYKSAINIINNKHGKKKKNDNWSFLHTYKTNRHLYGDEITKESVYAALNECWKEVRQFETEVASELNL